MKTVLCIAVMIAAGAAAMTTTSAASTPPPTRQYVILPEAPTRHARQVELNDAARAGYRLVTIDNGSFYLVRP
jgi:hypothetical protein